MTDRIGFPRAGRELLFVRSLLDTVPTGPAGIEVQVDGVWYPCTPQPDPEPHAVRGQLMLVGPDFDGTVEAGDVRLTGDTPLLYRIADGSQRLIRGSAYLTLTR